MANPIVSRTEQLVSSTTMTIAGVIKKTAFLLSLSGVSAFGLFFYAMAAKMSSPLLYTLAIGSMLVDMGLGLLSAFKPHLDKSLAVPYALTEGLLLGSISIIFYRIYPNVPLTALSATFVTAAIMLALYATGVVKVTEKFRSIITSAIIAIGILYLNTMGISCLWL